MKTPTSSKTKWQDDGFLTHPAPMSCSFSKSPLRDSWQATGKSRMFQSNVLKDIYFAPHLLTTCRSLREGSSLSQFVCKSEIREMHFVWHISWKNVYVLHPPLYSTLLISIQWNAHLESLNKVHFKPFLVGGFSPPGWKIWASQIGSWNPK